jgi:hypothetical protein
MTSDILDCLDKYMVPFSGDMAWEEAQGGGEEGAEWAPSQVLGLSQCLRN